MQKHHTSEGEVKKEEFVAMSKEVMKVESFSLGKATVEFAMFLFGGPACAFLAKRILPGLLAWFLLHAPVPDAAPHQLAFWVGDAKELIDENVRRSLVNQSIIRREKKRESCRYLLSCSYSILLGGGNKRRIRYPLELWARRCRATRSWTSVM